MSVTRKHLPDSVPWKVIATGDGTTIARGFPSYKAAMDEIRANARGLVDLFIPAEAGSTPEHRQARRVVNHAAVFAFRAVRE